MKTILLFIASVLMSSFIVSAYAAEVTEAPSMKSNSNTSITIEWNEDQDALGYYIHYDTASWEESWYRNEVPDLVEGTEYTIEWLSPSTQYFIAVSAVDIDAEESATSPEAALFTTGEDTAQAFALESVEATGVQELTLTFNADLENEEDSEREFLVLDAQTEEEIFIADTELDEEDSTKLMVSLDRELELGASYNFTILSIIDANGRNIESGIDALTNFEVPESFPTDTPEGLSTPEVVEENQEEAPQEELQEESVPDLNAAASVDTESNEDSEGWNAGQVIASDDSVDKDTWKTAEENETLPQTGPEHVLLLLLALMVWGIVLFSFTQKKKV